ncbi:MAG: hypothetical protein ACE5K4_00815 [Candidatus Hydrothermarchaeota archaeon]
MTDIIILGTEPKDSGKTTIARGIALNLKKKGVNFIVFKPRSGHNYWYHYEHTKKCLKKRLLYSKDAETLVDTINANESIQLINPIHRLWSPLDIFKAPMKNSEDIFVIDRVTISKKTTIFLNQERHLSIIPENLVEKFFSPMDEKVEVRDQFGLEEHIGMYTKAIKSSHEALRKKYDIIMIEGLQNFVYTSPVIEPGIVIIAAPNRLLLYDPDDFMDAIELISQIKIARVSDLINILKPQDTFIIPPADSAEIKNSERIMEILEKPTSRISQELGLV